MDEYVLTVCGYQYGSFEPRDGGSVRNYASLYVLEPFLGEMSSERTFTGVKCAAYKVVNKSVLQGIKPHDKVQIFFDQYKRVNYIKVVESAAK